MSKYIEFLKRLMVLYSKFICIKYNYINLYHQPDSLIQLFKLFIFYHKKNTQPVLSDQYINTSNKYLILILFSFSFRPTLLYIFRRHNINLKTINASQLIN